MRDIKVVIEVNSNDIQILWHALRYVMRDYETRAFHSKEGEDKDFWDVELQNAAELSQKVRKARDEIRLEKRGRLAQLAERRLDKP